MPYDKVLTNNLKALGIHICVVFIAFFLVYFLPVILGKPQLVVGFEKYGFLITFLYILCGALFLKPTSKWLFLSPIFVLVVLLIVIIACELGGGGDLYWFYVYSNLPAVMAVDVFPNHLRGIDNLSLIIPSLLMYTGLLFRVYFNKRKVRTK